MTWRATSARRYVVVTNGEARVHAKKIARRLGVANKRVRLATPAEAVAECGYTPGSVPPFGHRKDLRVFVDSGVPEVPGGVLYGRACHIFPATSSNVF